MSKLFLGLGKTLFNSSAVVLRPNESDLEIELLLSERLTRKKACGTWPEKALEALSKNWDLKQVKMAENRDVAMPQQIENFYNKQFPFFEHLKSKNLQHFTSLHNPDLKWLPHHFCHANAAHSMSPFEKAIIVVMDGAGSNLHDFPENHSERKNFLPQGYDSKLRYLEECSVYLEDGNSLKCVEKNWQVFTKDEKTSEHWFSHGLGSLYEKCAEFIFNDKRSAGKVMGLAAYGRVHPIPNRTDFLHHLDWSQAFKGKTKADWEKSENYSLYCDVAASVQNHFEESVLTLIKGLHSKYPDYKNLILMGGCALNCTTNMKIFDLGLFDSIYVPPFPGDESIGLGAASALYFETNEKRTPRPWEYQNGYFGSRESVPRKEKIKQVFKDFDLIESDNIESYTAEKLSKGHIIGWFQGRSETGPRALGNRSILARVDKVGLKDHLNAIVKMRESFRPYGCSVAFEKAHHLFEIPKGFENPFMSFAVKCRQEVRGALNEVTHFDGTSRMQTVRATQNARFHKLLIQMERLTGLPCVLNTSLNVMGQPIVETLEDAKDFLLNTEVSGLAIGDFYIAKPQNKYD